jgi:drug/metabolite transporter (DMT)-like permease
VLYSLITGQSVPKLFWLGLPLTFVGLFLAVFDFESALSIDPVGFVITLFNTLAMGSYFVLSARFFKGESSKYDGTKWMLTGAMLFSLLWIPVLGIQTPESLLSWLLMLSLGIIGTFVPLLAINMGLQLVGAARGSVIITLHPVIAVLLSTIFLGEQLMVQQWIGGGLVIAAIILLQLSADRETKAPAEAAR